MLSIKGMDVYKAATIFAALLLAGFLLYSSRTNILHPTLGGCWKDIVGGEISSEIILRNGAQNDAVVKNTRIIGAINCSALFGAAECVKYSEKTTQNGIFLGEEIRMGPKNYLGSYLILDDELIPLDEFRQQLTAVCEGGRAITLQRKGREFSMHKVRKKEYMLNGATVHCCEVRIDSSGGNYANVCISPDLCNTVFEVEQQEGSSILKSRIIDYRAAPVAEPGP